MSVPKCLLIVVFLVALTGFVAYGAKEESPQVREKASPMQVAMGKWQKWLSESFAVGDDRAKIERLMAGKFRDRGAYVYGGSGSHGLYYLIDDVQQVKFDMSLAEKLQAKPIVMRKGMWLKGPDGYLVTIPEPQFTD